MVTATIFSASREARCWRTATCVMLSSLPNSSAVIAPWCLIEVNISWRVIQLARAIRDILQFLLDGLQTFPAIYMAGLSTYPTQIGFGNRNRCRGRVPLPAVYRL